MPRRKSAGDSGRYNAESRYGPRKILQRTRICEAIAVMHDLHTTAGAIHGMQVLISAFLAVLFLQSGIDKVVDRRGNLEWLKGHFAKSPLAGMVPVMVTIITIIEVAAGTLSAVGCMLIF